MDQNKQKDRRERARHEEVLSLNRWVISKLWSDSSS